MSEQASGALSDVLGTLAGIVRLRKGPEDLPVSPALLLLAIAASVVVDAVTIAVLPLPFEGGSALLILIDVVTTLLWFGALLRIAGRPERFLQTLTAVFGFQLLLAPAMILTGWLFVTYQQDPAWQLPTFMMRAVVEIWELAVTARILRSATEWPIFGCVVLSFAYKVLAVLLVAASFPQSAAAA